MNKFVAFLLYPLSLAAIAQGMPLRPTDSVIYLTKNTNHNQVHYGVHVDEKCRPMEDEPAYAYWRMLEKGPGEQENLKFWEQPGYGVQQSGNIRLDNDSGSFSMVIRGVPKRTITLETVSTESGCKARALTEIDNREAVLERVEIQVSGWANVHKVEIFGTDSRNGKAVSEVTHEE